MKVYLLLKSEGQFKHSGKYYLLNGHWHLIGPKQQAPKGAPVAAHPHAAGEHAPVKHFQDHEWDQLKLHESNVNAGTYNKQLDQLKQHSEAGHVTGILGAQYGTNTYGKKLAHIANHLLEKHGSPHKVTAGQKAGEHPAVQSASANAESNGAIKQADLKEAAPKHATSQAPVKQSEAEKPKTKQDYVDAIKEAANKKSAFDDKKGDLKSQMAHVTDAAQAKNLAETYLQANGHSDEAKAEVYKQLKAHGYGDSVGMEYKPKAAEPEGPKEGDTKEGADGTLVFHNGHWHKQEQSKPQEKPQAKHDATGGHALPAMPDYAEGKESNGVVDYYTKATNKVLELSKQGKVAELEQMQHEGLKPKANGKIGQTFKGKTQNSKKFLAMFVEAKKYAEAIASGATHQEQAETPAAKPEPAAPVAEQKPAEQPKAASNANLSQIDWDKIKYPEQLKDGSPNKQGVQANKKIAKIKQLAEAGDIAALEAMTFGTNTYAKLPKLAAMTAIAALKETPAANTTADDVNTIPDTTKLSEAFKNAKAKEEEPKEEPKAKEPKEEPKPEADPESKAPTPEAFVELTEQIEGKNLSDALGKVSDYIMSHGHHPAAYKDALDAMYSSGFKETADKFKNATTVKKKLDEYEQMSGKPQAVEPEVPKVSADWMSAVKDVQRGMASGNTQAIEDVIWATDDMKSEAAKSVNKYAKEALAFVNNGGKPSDNKSHVPAPPDLPAWEDDIEYIKKTVKTNDIQSLQQIVKKTGYLQTDAGVQVHEYAKAMLAYLKAKNGEQATEPASQSNTPPVGHEFETFGGNKYKATADGWQNTDGEVYSYYKPKGSALTLAAGFSLPDDWNPNNSESIADMTAELAMAIAPKLSGNDVLSKIYPAGKKDGPKEGDIKTIDGVQYQLINGRWHKISKDEPAAEQPKSAEMPRKPDEIYGHWKQEFDAVEAAGKAGDLAALEKALEEIYEPKTDTGKKLKAYIEQMIDHVKSGKEQHPIDAVPMPDVSGMYYSDAVKQGIQNLKNAVKEHGPSALNGIAKKIKGKVHIKLTKDNGHVIKVVGYEHLPEKVGAKVYDYVMALKEAAGKPKKKPAAKKSKAPVIGTDGIESMDSWKKTGGQLGSNAGGRFKDQNGDEWYCKWPDDEEAAKAEVLAAKLYSLAGVTGQDAKLITKDGKIGIASRWTTVSKTSAEKLKETDGVLSGFAVDAWLANWDVVGLSYDNLQVGADGKAVRIDAGGSLMYRAQGEKKEFGNVVKEIDSLRDPATNSQAAAVFGNMTDADIAASVAKVAKIPDSAITKMVMKSGFGDEKAREELAATLIARKNDLIAKFPKAAKNVKQRLDPSNLPVNPDKLPKGHDFKNWNGEGKGLSSQAHINDANDAVEKQMIDIAKTGNLTKLKEFEFEELSKETGQKTGKTIPISMHPSKHVVQLHSDLVQTLDEIANPPQALKVFRELDVNSMDELDAMFPPKPFGTTVNNVHSNEKLGFWVALGGVTKETLDKIKPKSVSFYPQEAIKAAYDKFKQGSLLARHFIQSVQASGSYNDLFRDGKTHDYNGNKLTDVAKAALEHATEMPEGTTLTRWQNMPADMVKKVLDAPDGTILQATGPMCTSYSPTATSHFGKHKVTIRYAKGAKGVESFGSGAFSGEKEVTTLPNSRFVVLSKKMVYDSNKGGERLELELLMLPPDIAV